MGANKTTLLGYLSRAREYKKYIFLVLGLMVLILAAVVYQGTFSGHQKLTGCISWNVSKNCQEIIQLAVDRRAVRNHELDLNGYTRRFSINFQMNDASFLRDSHGDTRVLVTISDQSQEREFEHVLSIYTRGVNLPISRKEAKDLIAISETARGFAGSEFLILSSGKKDVWFRCVKPYVAHAGNLVEDTGCTVEHYLQPGILIGYEIKRNQLVRWSELNDQMVRRVKSVVLEQQ